MRVWDPCMMSLALLRRRERPTGLCRAGGGASVHICAVLPLCWRRQSPPGPDCGCFSALPAMPQQQSEKLTMDPLAVPLTQSNIRDRLPQVSFR